MQWQLYGPHALLVRFATRPGEDAFARGCAIASHLTRNAPRGMTEFVSGFTTVLIEFDPYEVANPADIAPALLAELDGAANERLPPGPIKEIPIAYDGPDLDKVAAANGLSTAEVRAFHAHTVYKVYFLGFAPGFPYLGDLDSRLHTPRLASPRVRVPAGSVAIGGEHTGIYTVDSPGGWNIIGHTHIRIFDSSQPDERAQFRLQAGDRVKFVT